MDPLANVGGCPEEWQEWTNVPGQTKYEEGDTVSLNGLVYECKSALCSSAGFQPEEDVAGTCPEMCPTLSIFSQHYKLTDFVSLSL